MILPETDFSGWYFANNTWYCFQNGIPVTGWVTEAGVRYYLQEDGSVTTGYTKVEEQELYFSATGALCNGWMYTRRGMLYLQDGVPVTGWQEISGSMYYFQDNGRVKTSGTLENEGVTYTIRSDGKAIPKLEG